MQSEIDLPRPRVFYSGILSWGLAFLAFIGYGSVEAKEWRIWLGDDDSPMDPSLLGISTGSQIGRFDRDRGGTDCESVVDLGFEAADAAKSFRCQRTLDRVARGKSDAFLDGLNGGLSFWPMRLTAVAFKLPGQHS